jgi:hypothetical protein
MTKSIWASRFALKRRAIDRALLAECERRIAAEERAQKPQDGPRGAEATQTPPKPDLAAYDPAAAIARAFGRPVQ